MMTETPSPRKTPRAWYGWLYDEHGIYLIANHTLSFRADATETWQTVDLPTFRMWGQANGEVAVAEWQALADGDRVYQCSKTLQTA